MANGRADRCTCSCGEEPAEQQWLSQHIPTLWLVQGTLQAAAATPDGYAYLFMDVQSFSHLCHTRMLSDRLVKYHNSAIHLHPYIQQGHDQIAFILHKPCPAHGL